MFIRQNTIAELSSYTLAELILLFDEREARSVHHELFRHYFHLNRAELQLKRDERLSESQLLEIHHALKRLSGGEPLQYITGSVQFHGMELEVNTAVLIPRPETEELVSWLANYISHSGGHSPGISAILDIGTGSGCIALALKKFFPLAEVHACDVSKEALAVAKRNSSAQQLEIIFHHLDVLKEFATGSFDIIISNPPYILKSEMNAMQKQVTEHEPHRALFVPDEDPLLFYKRIITSSKKQLNAGGVLVFETHEKWNDDVAKLLVENGFSDVEVFTDMQDKLRGILGRH
ncbi:MAG: peptide chain release factor N(5)-glutamine methyltransferase [Flavobacteriales bacterium]|nr:peptide chain release factor N(5)-glutamine methyltransferase [Flavobacteriales bacterium]